MSLSCLEAAFPLIESPPREELNRCPPSQVGEGGLVLRAEVGTRLVVDDGEDTTGGMEVQLEPEQQSGSEASAHAGKSSLGVLASLGNMMHTPE